MNSESFTPLAADDESWVTVRNFSTLDEANDHGLVALALGEECRVEISPESHTFSLQIEHEPSPKLEQELDAFHEEMREAREAGKAADAKVHSSGWAGYFIWIAALMGAYLWQTTPGTSDELFLSSSHGLIEKGQWWRPLTSLFLHADAGHLLGNMMTGLIFTLFVSRTFGPWKAWVLILLCGSLGNALNAWLRYPEVFFSLGASTAVFAALGLLSGSGLMESWRMRPHWSWAKVVSPMVAGFVLLGMLGAGKDPQTNVLGHMCGFVVGVSAGMIVGHFEHKDRP